MSTKLVFCDRGTLGRSEAVGGWTSSAEDDPFRDEERRE